MHIYIYVHMLKCTYTNIYINVLRIYRNGYVYMQILKYKHIYLKSSAASDEVSPVDIATVEVFAANSFSPITEFFL
jgi:hypothetical protein